MDYKDEMSSNNLSQPSGDQINLSENQDDKERRAWNWSSPVVLAIVGFVVILLVAGMYLGVGHRQPTPQTATIQVLSPSPVGSGQVTRTPVVELPPLYPGMQWEATKSGELVFPTRNSGSVKLEGYYNESVRVMTVPKDFLAYYERELPKMGWDEIAFAGGGTSGESHGYEKNGHYFLFGFRRRGVSEDEYQAIVQYN